MSELSIMRLSDAPFVEKVWYMNTLQLHQFVSQADSNWELVVTRYEGKTTLTVRGPETQATRAEGLPDAEHLGIIFKIGAFMPPLPLKKLVNRQDKNLPEAGAQSFWLNGSAWEYPTYENADTFINRLIRQGILEFDPVVEAVIEDQPLDLSLRTVQRRFVQATGITHKTYQQIERARLATALLIQGKPILETAFEIGYYDQSHLTNALTRFMGITPAQIAQEPEGKS